mgnify:CR=1 FL=1
MGNFGQKIDRFVEIFLEQNGYVRVLEGLQNTVLIAVTGLIMNHHRHADRNRTGGAEIQDASESSQRILQLLCGPVPGNADGSTASGVLLCGSSPDRGAYDRRTGGNGGFRH